MWSAISGNTERLLMLRSCEINILIGVVDLHSLLSERGLDRASRLFIKCYYNQPNLTYCSDVILKLELVMDLNLPILSLIKTGPGKMTGDKWDPKDLTKRHSTTKVKNWVSKAHPPTNLLLLQIIRLMSKEETKRFRNSKIQGSLGPEYLLVVSTTPWENLTWESILSSTARSRTSR